MPPSLSRYRCPYHATLCPVSCYALAMLCPVLTMARPVSSYVLAMTCPVLAMPCPVWCYALAPPCPLSCFDVPYGPELSGMRSPVLTYGIMLRPRCAISGTDLAHQVEANLPPTDAGSHHVIPSYRSHPPIVLRPHDAVSGTEIWYAATPKTVPYPATVPLRGRPPLPSTTASRSASVYGDDAAIYSGNAAVYSCNAAILGHHAVIPRGNTDLSPLFFFRGDAA
eukprot:1444249-Rhodomonas_salina.6